MWQGEKVSVVKSISYAYALSRLIHKESTKKIQRISRGGSEEVAKGRSWELPYWHVVWQFCVALGDHEIPVEHILSYGYSPASLLPLAFQAPGK